MLFGSKKRVFSLTAGNEKLENTNRFPLSNVPLKKTCWVTAREVCSKCWLAQILTLTP